MSEIFSVDSPEVSIFVRRELARLVNRLASQNESEPVMDRLLITLGENCKAGSECNIVLDGC